MSLCIRNSFFQNSGEVVLPQGMYFIAPDHRFNLLTRQRLEPMLKKNKYIQLASLIIINGFCCYGGGKPEGKYGVFVIVALFNYYYPNGT